MALSITLRPNQAIEIKNGEKSIHLIARAQTKTQVQLIFEGEREFEISYPIKINDPDTLAAVKSLRAERAHEPRRED